MPTPYQCKHGRSFDPAKESCPDCDSAAPEPDDPILGEGEMLCIEARHRGLPNGFDVEQLVFDAWKNANAQSDKCVRRSDQLADIEDSDAIRWEMAAAKWADTAMKAAKIVAAEVQNRERIAAADRADRAQLAAERQH